ncbi:hypothetical protein L0222_02350, partial [bacterium]|nr:hypothetical protein [bacterium]
ARNGDSHAAKEIFNKANKTAQQIKHWDSKTWSKIARAEARSGLMEMAVETAKQITAKDTLVEAWMEIDQTHASELIAAAISRARTILNASDAGMVLQKIAQIQIQAGLIAEALLTAGQIESASHCIQTLIEIGLAQLANGQTKEATKTLEAALNASDKMEGENKVNALLKIAAAQMQSGEMPAAKATLDSAFQITRSIRYHHDRVKLFPKVGLALFQAAELQRAKHVYIEARDMAVLDREARDIEGLDRDEYWLSEQLVDIAAAQAESGEFEDAMETARLITKENRRIFALQKIAIAQAKAGRGEEAVKTSWQILMSREVLLPPIAEALASLQDIENFNRLLVPCAASLQSALPICLTLSHLYPQHATGIANAIIRHCLDDSSYHA